MNAKPIRRAATLALLLAAASPLVHADALTQADREALLERLEKMSDSAREKAMGRIGTAASAFKSGMNSDEAAVELYLKCVQKVDFDQMKRSAQEFREWERGEKNRLKEDGVGRCLRHQLRWLVLTLEAAEAKGQYTSLIPKVNEALDSIYSEPGQFGGDVEPLRRQVLDSAYARAYNLAGAQVNEWPQTPLDVAQIFEKIIFPPLRSGGRTEVLREQWLRRIKFESVIEENWGKEPRRGPRPAEGRRGVPEPRPEYQQFLTEKLPDLKWQMEMDLFKAGDQRRAAANMFAHIETNLAHPKAREWSEALHALISAGKPSKATADTTTPVE